MVQINQLYTRNQFAVCKEQLLSPEEITRRPQGKLPLQFLKQVGGGTWDGIVGQKVYRNNVVVVPQDSYVTQNVIIVYLIAKKNNL